MDNVELWDNYLLSLLKKRAEEGLIKSMLRQPELPPQYIIKVEKDTEKEEARDEN